MTSNYVVVIRIVLTVLGDYNSAFWGDEYFDFVISICHGDGR